MFYHSHLFLLIINASKKKKILNGGSIVFVSSISGIICSATGISIYSASKGAAEIIFSAYARSFFASRPTLGVATTRAGNVIGGGDWAADRIIPDCIKAIEKDTPIQIRNPLATRPWQHVLEPLSGYLMLAETIYFKTTTRFNTVHLLC